ncbi:MAG: ceramidase domain-containing protein [Elusimicrobia bacterium]|nr:ceramidase domain-containing protein [Elusimicrobiota bacterium]
MNPRLVPPLPAGSPWSGWALPDIKHCEANLSGWIAAPANTWSNLPYLAVGLWIMARSPKRSALSAGGLGPVSVAVGVSSFVFHASYTFAGQVLDYAGMFLLIGWALARGLLRAGLLAEKGALRFWGGLFAASMAALFAFRAAGWGIQTIVLAESLLLAALEIRLMIVKRDAPSYAPLWLCGFLLIIAYACWHLDHTDFACRPDDHRLQFHAVWHVVTAGAFAAAWRFHEGIDARAAQ